MSAGSYDIEIEQGASWSTSLVWQAGDPLVPVNLTGYTVRAQIRAIPTGELAATITATITNAAAGAISLALTAEQTSGIPVRGNTWRDKERYVWDLEAVSSGGQVTRLLNGYAHISPEVTR